MFATLPLPAANADPREALRVYCEACKNYSTDDVELAVRQFIDGTVQGVNTAFAPTAPQFVNQMRENLNYTSKMREKRFLLQQQFRDREMDEAWQKQRTPEAKERVKAILDSLKKKQEERTPEEQRIAMEWLHRTDQHFESEFIDEAGVKVSKYLANTLRSDP